MASTTTRRKGGPPKSTEGFKIAVPLDNNPPLKAEVKRNKCGTSPFDEHWLNLDCCGLVCAFITYCLHIYGVYTVCLILIPPWMSSLNEEGVRTLSLWGHFHRLSFTLVAVLACYAHFRAMTTDPGAVPPDAMPLTEDANNNVDNANGVETLNDPNGTPKRGKRLCRRCNTFKPKRAHHCSVCQRCIIKMDHHCPWVNNCVGIGNHKYFLLFIFYTFVSCIYSFCLVIVRFYSCMGRHTRMHHMSCLDYPTQLMNVLGLIVEAILFGLFTSCMMCDQASVVTTNMTHIDRLKGDTAGAVVSGVIEVFGLNTKRETTDGSRFRPDWLSPFAKVCFPGGLHEEIMGFCRPCGGNGVRETEMASTNSPMVRSVQEIV